MFRTQQRLRNLEHLLEQTKSELERSKSEMRQQDRMILFTTDVVSDLYDAAATGQKKLYSVVEKHFQGLDGYVTGLFEYQPPSLVLKAATVPDGPECIRELERISDYRKARFSVPIEDSPYLKNFCANPSISDVGFNRLISQMVRPYLVRPIESRFGFTDARATLYPLRNGPEFKGVLTVAGNEDPDIIRPYMEIIALTLSYTLYMDESHKTKPKQL